MRPDQFDGARIKAKYKCVVYNVNADERLSLVRSAYFGQFQNPTTVPRHLNLNLFADRSLIGMLPKVAHVPPSGP